MFNQEEYYGETSVRCKHSIGVLCIKPPIPELSQIFPFIKRTDQLSLHPHSAPYPLFPFIPTPQRHTYTPLQLLSPPHKPPSPFITPPPPHPHPKPFPFHFHPTDLPPFILAPHTHLFPFLSPPYKPLYLFIPTSSRTHASHFIPIPFTLYSFSGN